MPNDEVKILLSKNYIEELASSFHNGPIQENGMHLLLEKEVGKIKGLKIEVFSNEHPPPHFRVTYQGETANYEIKNCHKLNGDLNNWTRNIKKWHVKNKYNLIQTWDKMRPTDCSVGEYEFDQDELVELKIIVDALDENYSEDMKYL